MSKQKEKIYKQITINKEQNNWNFIENWEILFFVFGGTQLVNNTTKELNNFSTEKGLSG